jgi:hypothetical protein
MPQAYPLARRKVFWVYGGKARPVPPGNLPRGGCARSTGPLTVAVHRSAAPGTAGGGEGHDHAGQAHAAVAS